MKIQDMKNIEHCADDTGRDSLFEKLIEELCKLQDDEDFPAFLDVLDRYAPKYRLYVNGISACEVHLKYDLPYYLKCLKFERAGCFEETESYYIGGRLYESTAGKEYVIEDILCVLSRCVAKITDNGLAAEKFYEELDFAEDQFDKGANAGNKLPHLYSIEAEFAGYLKDYRTVRLFLDKLPPEFMSGLFVFNNKD